jgi:hypothetical protein
MSRPRIYPVDASATVRVTASLKALKQQGGARKTFRLKPDANRALAELVELMGSNTETEAVEMAIIAARDALVAPAQHLAMRMKRA